VTPVALLTRPVVVVHVTHHPCGTVELARWVDGRRAAGWRYGPGEETCVCSHPKASHDVRAEDPTGSKQEACMWDSACGCDAFIPDATS
jgi:hypothetical protein